MQFVLALGILGTGLYYSNKMTVDLYDNYLQSRKKAMAEQPGFPVNFDRLPQVFWAEPSDLVSAAGMPEGEDGLDIYDKSEKYNTRGVFGCPMNVFNINNILYPYYRTECLRL